MLLSPLDRAGFVLTYRAMCSVAGLSKRPFDIAEGLLRRHYSDANIEAILGGNFRRVLREIWTS